MKKRYLLSFTLSLLASISGILLSFSPAIATALESNRYVALGDSVAAGAGLAPLTNATSEDEICDRSTSAYPYAVARTTGLSLEHYACSGAKTDEGIYGPQETATAEIEAQLDRAYAAGTPDVITVTIGANDMRWTRLLKECYLWNCGGRLDNAQTAVYRADLRWELYHTLSLINARSQDFKPKVIFTGYFMPFSTTAPTCENNRNITPAEMTWLNDQVGKLNQTIIDSASWYDFASYAPVDFTGHELCTANPWIQGIQSEAPYHPTTLGQKAIARSVSAALTE